MYADLRLQVFRGPPGLDDRGEFRVHHEGEGALAGSRMAAMTASYSWMVPSEVFLVREPRSI